MSTSIKLDARLPCMDLAPGRTGQASTEKGDSVRAVRIVPGPEGGRLEIQDLPLPVPGPGQVLVRVMASGLNRGEIGMVKRARTGAPLPAGVEFAGVVAATGADVRGWHEG